MQITCNGKKQTVPDGSTLGQLLATLNLEPQTVVAEINKTIIEPDHYANRSLQEGDLVELIRFVGGG